MRPFVIASLTVTLIGCASAPKEPAAPSGSQLPSVSERQRQLQEAAAHAEAVGDFRPYPDGWPTGTLPLRHDPNIAQSIRLGQTRTEVANVMGQTGWSHSESRRKFLDRLHSTYEAPRSSYKLPQGFREIGERLPAQGRFVYWEYQGFPSTADWVVVFFASPDKEPEAEPRVISRGVFRLGDF
jgi:hypothetical protein